MQSKKISQRIRIYLEKKDMDIEDLAARTDLDPKFLRSVRDENVCPSLGPLLKIARALGIRLGTLLDDQVSDDPLIIRQSDRKEQLSILRGKDKPVELRFYSLGTGKTDRHMEPFFIEVLPESAEDKALSSHEGEEFIVVLSGRIEIIYGKEIYELGTGDSTYYNSLVPHRVSCIGDQPATIHAVLYIPQ